MTNNRYFLAKQLGELCIARNIKIAVAESCTGGSLSALLTDVPGSSTWFNGAAVVYSNFVKENVLDVPQELLKQHGAVSEPVSKAMAAGALLKFSADIAVSITGVAGPNGGSAEKPVGTVCFGLASKQGLLETKTAHFTSGRDYIRQSASVFAIEWLMNCARNQ